MFCVFYFYYTFSNEHLKEQEKNLFYFDYNRSEAELILISDFSKYFVAKPATAALRIKVFSFS